LISWKVGCPPGITVGIGATDEVEVVVGSGKGTPFVMVSVMVCVTVTVFFNIDSIIVAAV
jgi:hypothetical protein